jgi:hypothetical protein
MAADEISEGRVRGGGRCLASSNPCRDSDLDDARSDHDEVFRPSERSQRLLFLNVAREILSPTITLRGTRVRPRGVGVNLSWLVGREMAWLSGTISQ